MKVAIIGRSEHLLNIAKILAKTGYQIPLVITAKEAPEYKIKAKDFEAFAFEIGAKFIYSSKIDEIKLLDQIRDLGKIDIGASVNYTGIISAKVIEFFKHGILNAHGGDLPKYRGNACQAWAIINKEQKIGLCIHKMIAGELDSGDIIAREYLGIDINTKIGSIYRWMETIVPTLMVSAIEKLKNNPNYVLESQSKNSSYHLRCYPRLAEDGRIDWSITNEDILRLINASSEPFSGAFCYFEKRKMIIWNAELVSENENFLGIQGQVSKLDDKTGSIEIITGSGKIRIMEIEFEGKRMCPTELIKSLRKRLH